MGFRRSFEMLSSRLINKTGWAFPQMPDATQRLYVSNFCLQHTKSRCVILEIIRCDYM